MTTNATTQRPSSPRISTFPLSNATSSPPPSNPSPPIHPISLAHAPKLLNQTSFNTYPLPSHILPPFPSHAHPHRTHKLLKNQSSIHSIHTPSSDTIRSSTFLPSCILSSAI